MKIFVSLVILAALMAISALLINRDGYQPSAQEAQLSTPVSSAGDARGMSADVSELERRPRVIGSGSRAFAASYHGVPDSETVKALESRLLVGNALEMGVAQSILGAGDFERVARAISKLYAADADAVRSRALYAGQLRQHLAVAGSVLPTFECGLGYCLGEIEGPLGPGGEGALADAIDAGTFALLPWETAPTPRYRFMFSTDPSVREMQDELAGG
jgi:hypothetical protein